jgi:hypothetical protein
MLHFVKNDESAQVGEGQIRVGEPRQVTVVLQVEQRRLGPRQGKGTGQGGLSDLARAQKPNHRESGGQFGENLQLARAKNHLENLSLQLRFSR